MSAPESRPVFAWGRKREDQGGHEEETTKSHKKIGGDGNICLGHGDGFLSICNKPYMKTCQIVLFKCDQLLYVNHTSVGQF